MFDMKFRFRCLSLQLTSFTANCGSLNWSPSQAHEGLRKTLTDQASVTPSITIPQLIPFFELGGSQSGDGSTCRILIGAWGQKGRRGAGYCTSREKQRKGSPFQVIWGGCEIWELLEKKTSKIGANKINHLRQPLQKVCIQQFHGQDKDQFWNFWALLVQFGLGIMHQEGFCKLWILGFLRSKSSNLEVWKIWVMDVEMDLYLRKYKNLVKEVYCWSVVCCMGVWVVTFNFWFLKNYMWFLGRAKVWVERSFFFEKNKHGYWVISLVICGYCCETKCKSSIWSILFHLGVY